MHLYLKFAVLSYGTEGISAFLSVFCAKETNVTIEKNDINNSFFIEIIIIILRSKSTYIIDTQLGLYLYLVL